MTEWGVVGVVTALVGLFLAVYTPIEKARERDLKENIQREKEKAAAVKENTAAMTRLTVCMEALQKQFAQFEQENRSTHRRLWERSEEQELRLADHEKRIERLEQQ